MKKRIHSKKLVLNKRTIDDLTKKDMTSLLGGSGDPTCIGKTCYTGPCCEEEEEEILQITKKGRAQGQC